MATHKLYRDFSVSDLELHITSVGRLARLTRNLRERLDETIKSLELEQSEATAAYKLATLTGPIPWRAPVKLGITREEMSQTDLARALKITPTTVKNMVSDGRLPPPRVEGRRLLFSRAAIDAWVAEADGHRSRVGTQDGTRFVCP
jgi:excisionase family DNA binding protein